MPGTLAPEILNAILDSVSNTPPRETTHPLTILHVHLYPFPKIKDMVTMERLSQTCRGFRVIMASKIHARLKVWFSWKKEVAQIIANFEQCLTITQKKQLQYETRHEGQQATYPTNVDEHAVPTCTSLVRQMWVGIAARSGEVPRLGEYVALFFVISKSLYRLCRSYKSCTWNK